MAYVFGTTFVCDNMDNAKKVEIKSVLNILPLYNECQKFWLKGTGSGFSACSFIKMLFFCRHMLYRLCKQYDHVIIMQGTNVALVQIPASRFSPLLREVFPRVLRFFPLLKNQRFKIPIRSGIR